MPNQERMEVMKEFLKLVLVVVLLPVLFPLAIMGGWIFTTDKQAALEEMR